MSLCAVTGASGFIGGRIARRLATAGRELRCLGRVGSDLSGIEALGIPVARADVTDAPALERALEGVTEIVHCAAMVSDWGTIAEIEATNVTGTANVLRAAARAGVRRVVHLSTTDVYGHPGGRAVDESRPPGAFANWYAQTKLRAEREVLAAAPGTVVLRPATVYGPGSTEVVGEIARAIRGGHMLLIDRGQAVAGLCYVENLVDAVELALDAPHEPNGPLNVADGLGVTWARFTADLAAGLGARQPRLSLPYRPAAVLATALECGYRALRRSTGLSLPPLLSRQAVQVLGRDQGFANLRLRSELGWEPRVGYEQGLAETLAWLHEWLPATPHAGAG